MAQLAEAPHQVIAHIAELTTPNWDSYGADPITEKVVVMARAIVDALTDGVPMIAPGGDGSIGFEWDVSAGPYYLLMLDVKPDGTCEAHLATRNPKG